MPRALRFVLGDTEYPFSLEKVDRTKLYGFKETVALDENEDACELATLADDGRTLIGKGGTGLGWLDADGCWTNKADLRPHNVDGDLVEPVPSSFNAPIKLFETASEADFLQHNIRLVYHLHWEPGESSLPPESGLDDLMAELRRGTIFKYAYSYRGGLEADTAFMLLNESDELMMLVGNVAEVQFVGMQSALPLEEESESDGDNTSSMLSFDMI
ncbi:MAG: hypothetical protein ACE361_03805 [Aureliella sp.]